MHEKIGDGPSLVESRGKPDPCLISRPLDEKLPYQVTTSPSPPGPPTTRQSDGGLRGPLIALVEWLLSDRFSRGDSEIRPRHQRRAASRLAMRLAVLGLLAARERLPASVKPLLEGRESSWRSWSEAARRFGALSSDPLFQPAEAGSIHPETRALAGLEATWDQRADSDLAAPAFPAEGSSSPSSFLGTLYQQLLEVGNRTGARAGRKGRGSFYTGRELARPTVKRTLDPLIRGADSRKIFGLRICDPAMGVGPFLEATLHYLTEELAKRLPDGREDGPVSIRRLRRELATSVLHGVDIDPTAVDLGRWVIWLEVDDPEMPVADLTANLRVGNALFGTSPDTAGSDRTHLDRSVAPWLWPQDKAPSGKPATELARDLSEQRRSFHWQVEFPAVFASGGFDAVVGNPPWETLQPSSKEFFSELDTDYGRLGKQAALRRQQKCFRNDPASERDWQGMRSSSRQFARYAKAHFRHQGSGKLYTYRLFLERAHALLRPGGRLGMIVPSGLYTDLGSAPLRKLLLDHCRWEWLFCFENRDRLFDIDSRYRFGPIIVEKGGRTRGIRTAFLRRDPREWQAASPPAIPYTREQVDRLSPHCGALLDVRSHRDLALLDKIQSHGRPFLIEAGGDLHFAQGDFNMTSDSELFREREECEASGYALDMYGRWLEARGSTTRANDNDCIPMADGTHVQASDVRRMALPLYQGAMVYDLHPSAAIHKHGTGHRTKWTKTDAASLQLGPQYLIGSSSYLDLPPAPRCPQLVLRALSNATNERTVVPGLINDLPCGNSLVILRPPQPDLLRTLYGAGVMSSLVYDWSMRQRMAGTNLNRFILGESVWPEAPPEVARQVAVLAARLALITPRDAPIWLELRRRGWLPEATSWTQLLALNTHERAQLHSTLDAVVAALFELDEEELCWMLRDCHLSVQALRDRSITSGLDPKGFWRVDRDKEPGFRRTVMAIEAFDRLRREIATCEGDSRSGILAFCASETGARDVAIGRSGTHHPREGREAESRGMSWRLCRHHASQVEAPFGVAPRA